MAIRVLVVDDLVFMREVIRDILEDAGIEVAGEAADGKSGIKAYAAMKPDVVLMDITMPVMDGLRALRKIRDLDRHAVVVMCSSLGQQEYIIRAVQLGARDFIVKPFRPERVVSAVQKAARSHV
ncbi:MAG: two-component system response regulator [Spirochaetales bacterium]|nr:two-component system response regulator [Spirochaetales bacterium]